MPQRAAEPGDLVLSKIALDVTTDPRESIYEVHAPDGLLVGRLVRRRAGSRTPHAGLAVAPWRAQVPGLTAAWDDLDGWHSSRASALEALRARLTEPSAA